MSKERTVSSCHTQSMPCTYATVRRDQFLICHALHFSFLQFNKHIYSIIKLRSWLAWISNIKEQLCMFCTSVLPHDKVTGNAAPRQNKLRLKTSMWHLIGVAMLTGGITAPLFSLGLAASQAVWHPSHCCHLKDVVRDTTFCFSSRKIF